VANSILNEIRRAPRRRNRPFGRFCKPPGWRELLREDLVEQTALQWREIVRYVLARRERLRGDRYFEVSYEEICASPRGSYKAMFEFAGLAAGEDVLAGIPERLEDRNRPFATLFPPRDLETIERVQGELLAELGYPV
jgi:hypothetical protein